MNDMRDVEPFHERLREALANPLNYRGGAFNTIEEAARLILAGEIQHEETGRFVLNEETGEYDTIAKRRYRYVTGWIEE